MRYLLLISILFYVLPISAQSFPDSVFQDDVRYKVKLLDEFMKRFNGEETHDMLANQDSLQEELNILYLMNADMFKANKDSMLQVANEFIDSIRVNQTKLFYTDSLWYAEVMVNCSYKKKAEQITLFLRPEEIKPQQHRWVIIGAKGDILTLEPSRRNNGLNILPNNHEVGFMALPKIHLLGNDKILNYASANYRTDQLTVLYSMIYSGTLKMDTTDKIIYHFGEVPGFVFTVERHVREGFNSGWLISSIKKADSSTKLSYISHIQ